MPYKSSRKIDKKNNKNSSIYVNYQIICSRCKYLDFPQWHWCLKIIIVYMFVWLPLQFYLNRPRTTEVWYLWLELEHFKERLSAVWEDGGDHRLRLCWSGSGPALPGPWGQGLAIQWPLCRKEPTATCRIHELWTTCFRIGHHLHLL